MKMWKYYVIFVYILQGKMGKTEKNWEKKNHATKVTKTPKTKRWKYGVNKTQVDFLANEKFQKQAWIWSHHLHLNENSNYGR